MRLVLATRNEHKLREMRRMMPGHELVPPPPEVEMPAETGSTFADNAILKARGLAQAIGVAAIADDSGIEAYALGGRPGVHSARFAGDDASDEENLAKLLRDVPADGDRRVAYVCVIALAQPAEGDPELFRGRCEGTLASRPRGSDGFGYDPAFLPADLTDGRTMAELDPREKDAISHRGRAIRALLGRLAGEAEA